jgi:predicted amidophosphoribosyltransferase
MMLITEASAMMKGKHMIAPNMLTLAGDMAYVPARSIRFGCPFKYQSLIPEGMEKVILRHHKGAFIGCFSLRLRANVNWDLFKQWKSNRNPMVTDEMARDFIPFIRNHYDCITAAPPSTKRCPSRYCVYDLAKSISRMTHIPFIPAFVQKTDKVKHGRFASLEQSSPEHLESWNIRNKSILFIDDCITSGTTARLCYESLVALGNHVDGLIWVSAGG